ncbi:MAG: hypothetical protein ABJL67_12430 [Sulfitobacter sp.]
MLRFTDQRTKAADAAPVKEETFGEVRQSGFERNLFVHSFDKYTALQTVWIKD